MELTLEHIISQARETVEKYLSVPSDTSPWLYHNLVHTMEVWRIAKELGIAEKLSQAELDEIEIAALFHDSGYPDDPRNHEKRSCVIASEFLQKCGVSEERIGRICQLIMVTDLKGTPSSRGSMVIRDADLHYLGTHHFLERSNALRQEWATILHNVLTDKEWLELNIRFMEKHTFYTDEARRRYAEAKAANLETIRQQLVDIQE